MIQFAGKSNHDYFMRFLGEFSANLVPLATANLVV